MPEWATGYWQSNSYYTSQAELLAVAREHMSRGLPLSAMFVDFMHWTHLGEWEWDREQWPDPAAMVAELAAAGVRVMVAVWPHVSPQSKHFADLRDRGLLVHGPDGSLAVFAFADRAEPSGVDLALLDLLRGRTGLRQRDDRGKILASALGTFGDVFCPGIAGRAGSASCPAWSGPSAPHSETARQARR